MGELGNFLTRANINLNDSKELVDKKLKLVAKYSDQAMQTNPLHLHHTLNVEGAPTKGIMLSLQDRNDAAGKVVRNFNEGNIDKIEATKQLKKINTAALLGKEVVGAKTDVPLDRQLASATRRVNKMFFDALKQRPDVVEAIAKRFGIPGKVTAGALAGFLSFNAISPQEAVAGTGYETEIPTGLTTGEKLAGAGTAAAAFKFRKPIIKGAKAVGRAALKTLGPLAAPIELAFIGSDLKSGSSTPEALADVVMLGGIFRERDKRKFIKDKYGEEVLNTYVAAKTPGITDVMDIPTAMPELSKRLQTIDAEADQHLLKLREQRAKEFEKKSKLPKPEIDEFQAAGGGIAKLAGDRSGAMLESMNPDSQGLQGLMKRGIKT
tara:strand:- start:5 stop:1141 length:1137 start_codon:yes stop_codon:yes gene_type:complete